MSDRKKVVLEGYGKFQGQTLDGSEISCKTSIMVVEVTGPDGKDKQIKFNRTDGLAVGANGEDGWKLPAASLATLTKGKTASRPKRPDAPPRPAKTDPNPERKCFCGCEGLTGVGSRFIPGHDAKAHSRAKRYLRGQFPEEDLKKEHLYIQDHVRSHGGWNSEVVPERPKRVRTAEELAADNAPAPAPAPAPEIDEKEAEALEQQVDNILESADAEVAAV